MLFFAGGLLGLLAIGLWLFALVDVLTSPAEHIRNLQKVVWVLIVLFGLEIGAAFWFVYGRPRAEGAMNRPRPAGSPRTTGRGGSRATAPDDDIDFLRSINPHRPDEGGPTR